MPLSEIRLPMKLLLKYLPVALFGIWALISGCSSSTIVHDYDKNAAGRGYHSFAVQPPPQEEIDALNLAFPDRLQVHRYCHRNELTKRDYKLDNARPDLVAIYHVRIDMKQRAVTSGSGVSVGVGGGWGYGGYGGMGYNTTNLTTTYEDYAVGTVMMGLVDARTKKLVWQATSSGELSRIVARNPPSTPQCGICTFALNTRQAKGNTL